MESTMKIGVPGRSACNERGPGCPGPLVNTFAALDGGVGLDGRRVEELTLLAVGLVKVLAARQDHLAGALAVDAGVVDAGRHGACLLVRLRHGDELAAGADDEGIRGAE